MTIVLLLGEDDEYLDFRVFKTEEAADKFWEDHMPLIMANTERKLPLKERLKLAPEYFAFAGKFCNFEVITNEDINEALNNT